MRYSDKRTQSYFIESRKKVNEQFLKIGNNEENHQYAFKGSTATIVQDIESGGEGSDVGPLGYKLTRFARNPDGEYFMLIFTVTGGELSKPFLKHVPQMNARILLKEKYVPPKNVALP